MKLEDEVQLLKQDKETLLSERLRLSEKVIRLEEENEALKTELRGERRRLLTELYQNSAISEYQFTLAMKKIDELTGVGDAKKKA